VPKITSKRYELMKLCHINRSGPVFFETQCICPFICVSIRFSSVSEFVNMIFWKQIYRRWYKLAQVIHGTRHETITCEGQEVKVQGHKRPKMDLDHS